MGSTSAYANGDGAIKLMKKLAQTGACSFLHKKHRVDQSAVGLLRYRPGTRVGEQVTNVTMKKCYKHSIVLTCDADAIAVLLLVGGEVAVDGGAGGARPVVLGGGREAQRGHRHQRGRRLVLLQEEAALARGQHPTADRELEGGRRLRSCIDNNSL